MKIGALFAVLLVSLTLVTTSAYAQFHSYQRFAIDGLPQFPQALVAADLNGDGIPDLVTANESANTVSILLGKRGGTFQPHVEYAVGSYAWSVATGDYNEDHIPDVVASNEFGFSISLLVGKGDGTFAPATDFPASSAVVFSVTAVDLNLDGHLDAVLSTDTGVSVLLGNGNGTFRPYVDYSGLDESLGITSADVNRDGKPDIIATNALVGVSVFLGNGDGTLQRHRDFATDPGGAPVGVAIADFNLDGNLDLAVASQQTADISVLLGNGDGTFNAYIGYPTANLPYSVAVADFNRDGKPDLVAPNGFINSVSVLLGNGDGTFRTHLDYSTGFFPDSIIAADLNGDGLPDIANTSTDSAVDVLFQNGGTFVTTRSSTNPSHYGDPVTFTTRVTPAVPGSGSPTGTVTFTDGVITLGTAALVNGQASFTTCGLNIGVHAIAGKYSGDGRFKPHQGKAIAQEVRP